MELKRVIFNIKFIWLVIALLLINYILFTGEQLTSGSLDNVLKKKELRQEYLKQYKADDLEKINTIVADEFAEKNTLLTLLYYNKMKTDQPEAYEEYGKNDENELRINEPEISILFDNNKDILEESELSLEAGALNEIKQQIEYIISYPDYLNEIDERAELMKQISIFNQKDSAALHNIIKTVADYSRLKGITLSLGSDRAITSVLNFKMSHYIMLISIIVFIFNMIYIRNHGLWCLINATRNGRIRLFYKRCGLIFFASFIITVLIYGGLFIVGFALYGGAGDLNRPIQSISMFKDYTMIMSVCNFLVFFLGTKILFGCLLGLFIWFILSVSSSHTYSMAMLGVFLGVEYAVYRWLPIQSNWNVFKYINVFCYINPIEVFSYHNIFLANNAVGLLPMLYSFYVLFLILSFIGCLLLNSKKKLLASLYKRNSFVQGAVEFVRKKSECWVSVLAIEFYKVYFVQKGFIIFALLFFFQFRELKAYDLSYGSADTIMNDFYQEMSGIPDEKVTKYLIEAEATLRNVDTEYRESVDLYKRKRISNDDYNNTLMKYSGYEGKRQALIIIQNQLEYIKQIADQKGIKAWLVNPRGYDNLLGKEAIPYQRMISAEAIFCLVLLLSGIFSNEKTSGSLLLVRTSKLGRNYLFHRKIYVSVMTTIIVWILIYGVELYKADNFYKLTCFAAPIQSLPLMKDIPYSISIGAFLLFLLILRLLLLLSVSLIICFISNISAEYSVFLSSLFLLGPSLLYMIGISMFKYISLTVPLGFMEILLGDNFYGFILLSVTLVSGIAAYKFSKNLWDHDNLLRRVIIGR